MATFFIATQLYESASEVNVLANKIKNFQQYQGAIW